MRILLFKIIKIALIALISTQTIALDPNKDFDQYVLDAWSIEKGLPQITVHAITQDESNYLWVGTQAGLARFDGVRFRTFSADNTPEIHGNFIQSLFTDSKGRVWIGSYKGLTMYYRGEFTKIIAAENAGVQLNINDVSEDPVGNIWITSKEGTYQLVDGKLHRYEMIPESSYSVTSTRSALYIGTVGKVWKIKNNKTQSLLLPQGYQDSIINHAIVFDKNVWLGTNKGLLVLETDSNVITEFKTSSPLYQYPIDSLGMDSDNNLWIGTIIGLFRIRDGAVVEHSPNDNPHNFQQILAFHEDHEKNLWFGSHRDGLARVWNGRTLRYSVEDGLGEPLVWSIIPSEQRDAVWTGTNRGLFILENGKFKQVLTSDQLSHPTAYTMLEEEEQLWVGTRKGLNRIANGKVLNVPHSDKLSSMQINSIIRDRNQQLWLGTSDGLFKYSKEELKPIKTDDNKSVFIRPILELNDGRIWAGTQKGLYEITNDSLSPVGLEQGLNQDIDVSGIYQFDDNSVVISTISKGLFFLYNQQWHHFTEDEGLPVNESFTVLADDRDHLWVSGFKGLYQVPVTHLIDYMNGKRDSIFAYMLLSESGGIIGSQKAYCCNGAGNSKGFFRDDKLWYPTRDGVVMLDTRDIQLNRSLPQVIIERFFYGDEWQSVHSKSRFILTQDERDVAFDFTALSFRDPKSVQFRYRLVGYQDEWRDLDSHSQRRVNYTNLPPGNYSFHVKASNNAGLWNPKAAEINFTIKPFFYESTWFYIICLIASAALVTAWHKLRLRSLELKKKELEGKIREHTQQLEISNRKLHDAVQALQETSQTDQLSGLKNRRYLSNQLPADLANFEREIDSHHNGHSMIFALADIDHFKQINDQHGHKAGDTIIKRFSQIIRDHIREGDYAVRWGGEEFIIVFRPMPPNVVPIIIDRLRKTIEEAEFYIARDKSLKITCSIGYAEYPFFKSDIHRLSWEHTVEIADHALYSVKENGRNGWACIKPTENTPVSKDILFTIKNKLTEEVDSGRLKIEASYLSKNSE
ncbi:ligand-binding sensor domain-containing protein [Pleionea sediminis]|uniref:ligand-binding sensor domain-containing protein n=1 Tax=Pleionea sediminis TaxID=2569479 RepID=UPI00118501CB|nr:ligand-binding sensor domain-containing diguanylate cyclase [Pleionea sediminis]